MKHVLLFCFLWPGVACAQTVRAQLTDFAPARIGPYCGYSKSATVLQFRLLPGRDTVLVVIPCARERGETLYQNGATYNMRLSTLATDLEWLEGGWELSSAYEHRAWPRWWCRGLERVK